MIRAFAMHLLLDVGFLYLFICFFPIVFNERGAKDVLFYVAPVVVIQTLDKVGHAMALQALFTWRAWIFAIININLKAEVHNWTEQIPWESSNETIFVTSMQCVLLRSCHSPFGSSRCWTARDLLGNSLMFPLCFLSVFVKCDFVHFK